MMNNSEEKDAIFVMCQVTESSSEFLSQFPKKYERNQIATLVVNFVLLFSTISLNGISIITITKSSQLRNKVCYFVILLQSIVDLSVGVFSCPVLLFNGSFSPYLKLYSCHFDRSSIISSFYIVSSNYVCNDDREVRWCTASLSIPNPSYKETNCYLRVRTWTYFYIITCLFFP